MLKNRTRLRLTLVWEQGGLRRQNDDIIKRIVTWMT